MNRFELLNLLQDTLQEELVVCNIGLPSQELYKINDRPNYFYMLGSMGLASSIGLGLSLAVDKNVISIDGDGSFNMTSNELKTFVEYNIPVKIAIMNDSSLQMVKIWEQLYFDGRVTATDNDNNPDYVKLGNAYGLQTLFCDNYEDLPNVINEFIHTSGPVLCEFKVEKDICLPLVGPGKALDEMILFQDYHNIHEIKLDGETPS